jgi:hypothetical protein
LFLLCFSDEEPGTQGPRRVSKKELYNTFAQGWAIVFIEPTRAEAVSLALCRGYLAAFGRILHHNTDKATASSPATRCRLLPVLPDAVPEASHFGDKIRPLFLNLLVLLQELRRKPSLRACRNVWL